MIEFLGGSPPDAATCMYWAKGDVFNSHHAEPLSIAKMGACLDLGFDVSRSLWDRRSLLIHLDVDYVNFDKPAEAYLHPERVFELLRPVELAIEAILSDYGIVPLHLLSGQGHHFVWRIGRESNASQRLAQFGRVPESLRRFYGNPHPPIGEIVQEGLADAYAGLGLVMEYLAHRVKETAAGESAIPVELTALAVGPGDHGREMVAIDVSEYGDPLSSRVIRVPFSAYLKPFQLRESVGDEMLAQIPPIFVIPLDGMDCQQGLAVRCDVEQVAELAGRTSASIPDCSRATEALIGAYSSSRLRRFHDWFYSQEHEPPETWPQTYDRTPMEALPGCVRHILTNPNDLLLKPSGLQRVVRALLALGWHPRHIAGLIRSKYERDFNWGDQWVTRDPCYRADFYTRLFASLFVAGTDDLVDFNCQSAKEEQLCFVANCPDNLAEFRTSLLERRRYERLACRPFNRLFSPTAHL